TYGTDERLPWDIIDTGVNKDFLCKEYQRAITGEKTSDCRKVCHVCGLKCKTESSQLSAVSCQPPFTDSPIHQRAHSPIHRMRVEFSKSGVLKYLSHLELVTAIFRAMRRAGIPLKYSQGFHPSPKVAFGPALGVGIAGIREYFDMEITPLFDIEYFITKMNSVLPEGLKIKDAVLIFDKEPSLSSFISRYEYEIICDDSAVAKRYLEQKLESAGVEDISIMDNKTVRLTLVDGKDKKPKLSEILPEIFGVSYKELDITRVAMYGWKGEWSLPLGIEPQRLERNITWLAKS
ncbi:MAG: TIGR03936 family radical SAM-associated protein, partial [Thermodesulfovibrionales bacterium]|nr:TIGR03936 family radical SAM-associated protein [Thermodesulfovibrionales bacterium]